MPTAGGNRFTIGDNPMALLDRHITANPYGLMAYYLFGLSALVAGLAITDGSTVFWLLFVAWLGLFFLFAVCVIVLAWAFIGVIAWRYLRTGVISLDRNPRSGPLAQGTGAGVWDEWLDG